MASGVITVNGYDLDTDLGLIPVSVDGLLGAPERSLALIDVPGAPGAIDAGAVLRESTRTIDITCLVQAATHTAIYTALDNAKETLGTGLVEIVGPYSTTRAFYGVMMQHDAAQFVSTVLNGWATVVLSFVCPMPYAAALTPSTIAVSTSASTTGTDIPLGTAPAIGRDARSAILDITGAATTPTVTYYNSAGDTVGTMAFTYSPAAGDTLRIDLGRRLITRRVSGTWSNAFSYLTAGYTWPALDPADGNVAASIWPRLGISSGVSGVLTYWKHYR